MAVQMRRSSSAKVVEAPAQTLIERETMEFSFWVGKHNTHWLSFASEDSLPEEATRWLRHNAYAREGSWILMEHRIEQLLPLLKSWGLQACEKTKTYYPNELGLATAASFWICTVKMPKPIRDWWLPSNAFRREDSGLNDLQQTLARLGLADVLTPSQAKTMALSPRSTLYKVVQRHKKAWEYSSHYGAFGEAKDTTRMYALVTQALCTIPYEKDAKILVGLDSVAHHLHVKPSTVRRVFQRGNLEGWCSQAKNIGPYDSHRDYTALSTYGWMSGWGPTYFRVDLDQLHRSINVVSNSTLEI